MAPLRGEYRNHHQNIFRLMIHPGSRGSGVCLSLGLLACVCAVLSGALYGGAAAAALPVVSVNASDPEAAEASPDAASFTLRRTLSTGKPLTVYYKVGGTAAGGADYAALAGSVVIPAGARTSTGTPSTSCRMKTRSDTPDGGARHELVYVSVAEQKPAV